LGLRNTIIGQRGRSAAPPPERARSWIARISSSASSSAAAIRSCTSFGSEPST
jgi:hypothetical protein